MGSSRGYCPSAANILRLPLRLHVGTRNPVSNLVPALTNPIATVGSFTAITPLSSTPAVLADRTLTLMAAYSTPPSVTQSSTWSLGVNSGAVTLPLAPRTDINKAPFSELWRAYWSVMADGTDPTVPPFQDVGSGSIDGRMFRTPSRNLPRAFGPIQNTVPFTSSMVMQLRSALAAVNAMDLRRHDADEALRGTGDITSREIPIYSFAGSTATLQYCARVYGTKKQPFITEVYANTYTDDPAKLNAADLNAGKKNPSGYIAVELYNPYNVPLVLDHWILGTISRPTVNQSATLSPLAIPTGLPPSGAAANTALPGGYGPDMAFLGGGLVTIPPGQYVVLENLPRREVRLAIRVMQCTGRPKPTQALISTLLCTFPT